MKNSITKQNFKGSSRKYVLTLIGTLFGFTAMANHIHKAPDYDSALSLFSSPLFNVLLGVIILLIIFIGVISGVLKDVAANKVSEKKNGTGAAAGVIALILLMSSSNSLLAQNAGSTELIAPYIDIPTGVFYVMLSIIVFEILILLVLMSLIKLFTRKEIDIETVEEEPSFLEMINASVAVEEEGEIMLDHEYDGIRELDNDLPPWWKYGFYLTIIVAVLYIAKYHIIQSSPLQEEEYAISIEKARIAKEEYQKMNANSVNENSVTMLSDVIEIEKGEKVYKEMCFACHGKYGEGGVGPNLTDEYWVHGGSIKDIFFSIKYGWPNKGMKSWEADMSPVQIHQLSSYIMTLKGTNPDNAKEKQGELYIEEVVIENDSINNDSTIIASSVDTITVH